MCIGKRFWEKVGDAHFPGDCWLWLASTRGSHGYGAFWDGEKMVYAHRFSYELIYGSIPKSAKVMHSCDDPLCVNPQHLNLGTDATNAQDKVSKGRHPKGAASSSAKLLQSQAAEIKKSCLSLAKLALQYGVSKKTVLLIKQGKRYA